MPRYYFTVLEVLTLKSECLRDPHEVQFHIIFANA